MTDESKSITARNSSEFGLWDFFFPVFPFCEVWYNFLPFLYLKANVSCEKPLWPREASNTGTWGRCDTCSLLLPVKHHSTLPSTPGCPGAPPGLAPGRNDPKSTPSTDTQPELGRATPSTDQLTCRAQTERCAGEVLKEIKEH